MSEIDKKNIEATVQKHIREYKLDLLGFITDPIACTGSIIGMLHANPCLSDAGTEDILRNYYIQEKFARFVETRLHTLSFMQFIHTLTGEILHKRWLEDPATPIDRYFNNENPNKPTTTISYLLSDISSPVFTDYYQDFIATIGEENKIFPTPRELYEYCKERTIQEFPISMKQLIQYIASEIPPYLGAIYSYLREYCYRYGWLLKYKYHWYLLNEVDIDNLCSSVIDNLSTTLQGKDKTQLIQDFSTPQQLVGYTCTAMRNQLIKLCRERMSYTPQYNKEINLPDYKTFLENNRNYSEEQIDKVLQDENKRSKKIAEQQIKNDEILNDLIYHQPPYVDTDFLKAISLLGPNADLLKIRNAYQQCVPDEENLHYLISAILDEEPVEYVQAITQGIDKETLDIIRMFEIEELSYSKIIKKLYPGHRSSSDQRKLEERIRQKKKRGLDILRKRMIIIIKP